jgi:hypothetical protein
MALYIAVTFSNPHSVAGVPDRVMFIADAHGCYSVKAGYQMLRKRSLDLQMFQHRYGT